MGEEQREAGQGLGSSLLLRTRDTAHPENPDACGSTNTFVRGITQRGTYPGVYKLGGSPSVFEFLASRWHAENPCRRLPGDRLTAHSFPKITGSGSENHPTARAGVPLAPVC